MKRVKLYEKYFFQLILFLVPIFIYYPVFTHDFLYAWDDRWQVLNGNTLGGLTFSNLYAIFSEYVMGQYSPLNQLFYTFIYMFFGPNPIAFHAVNIVWHLGCVWLVYRFVELLLCLRGEKKNARKIAFGVALLIVVHPVQVECVAWISASKILTSTFFFLLCMIAYLNYFRSGRIIFYLMTFISFVCSFFCKEQAILLLPTFVLLDWFMRRNLYCREIWLEKIPFFMLAVCFVAITLDSYVLPFDRMFVGRAVYPFVQRIAFTGYSLTEYITKLFFPINLMYLYPYPILPGESLPFRFWIYLPVLFVIVSVLWYGRKRLFFIFGCLFFLLGLSLALHIVPFPRAFILADRYLYLAAVGLFIPLIFELTCLKFMSPFFVKIKWVGFLIVVLYFGCYSNYRCRTWKNDYTLKKELKEFLREREPIKKIANYE